MQAFSQLFLSLDQSNKTLDKHKALKDYFNHAEDQDALWAISLFIGKKPRRPLKSSLLHGWAAELAGIPLWLFEESYQIVGDLSETISLITSSTQGSKFASLNEAMLFLKSLKNKSEEEQKEAILNVWQNSDALNTFVFNKLISGGFRVGVSDKLIIKAVAESKHMENSQVAYAFMGNWTPENTSLSELLNVSVSHDISKPYPFCLANSLDIDHSEIDKLSDWQAEYKWDGIRVQLIKRKGELFLWSRGEELIGERFPELNSFIELLPDGTVLDAELLAYKDGKILDFHFLQTRIGRKKPGPKTIKETPVILIAYDLFEWQSEDLREKPLAERRSLLERLVNLYSSDLLQISPLIKFKSWEELKDLRQKAREKSAEGLMLKLKSSAYAIGRKKGVWLKWKLDPLTIDAVLLYAQRGHGKRANLYTDYTFALWDQDKLVPFAKAYSGLSNEEIAKVDAWIKQHTKERFGPVRSVDAELVFEIAFEGVQLSPRHKSGIAVRFPRIHRWRSDKKAEEANSLSDLKAYLKETK